MGQSGTDAQVLQSVAQAQAFGQLMVVQPGAPVQVAVQWPSHVTVVHASLPVQVITQVSAVQVTALQASTPLQVSEQVPALEHLTLLHASTLSQLTLHAAS